MSGNLHAAAVFTSRDESDLVGTFNFSVAGYIIKPVDFTQLLDVVKVVDLYWSLSELAPCTC